jgi:hypothetical protein
MFNNDGSCSLENISQNNNFPATFNFQLSTLHSRFKCPPIGARIIVQHSVDAPKQPARLLAIKFLNAFRQAVGVGARKNMSPFVRLRVTPAAFLSRSVPGKKLKI